MEYSNSATNRRHRSRNDRDCADLETLREQTAGLPPEAASVRQIKSLPAGKPIPADRQILVLAQVRIDWRREQLGIRHSGERGVMT